MARAEDVSVRLDGILLPDALRAARVRTNRHARAAARTRKAMFGQVVQFQLIPASVSFAVRSAGTRLRG